MLQKSPISAYVLYGIASASFVFYAFYPRVTLTPLIRLALLGIICVSTYFGSLSLAKCLPEKQQKIMKITFAVFFALFVMLLITLVLFDSYFGRTELPIITDNNFTPDKPYSRKSINLIPLKTISAYLNSFKSKYFSTEQILVNIFGNLIAFTPLALFLPMFFKPMRSFLKFTAVILGMVILLEFLQFAFNVGRCDIDDVILNSVGACTAFWILKIKPLKKAVMKFTKLEY